MCELFSVVGCGSGFEEEFSDIAQYTFFDIIRNTGFTSSFVKSTGHCINNRRHVILSKQFLNLRSKSLKTVKAVAVM